MSNIRTLNDLSNNNNVRNSRAQQYQVNGAPQQPAIEDASSSSFLGRVRKGFKNCMMIIFPHFSVKTVTFIYCVLLFIVYIIEEIVYAANKSTSTWACTLYSFGAKFTYAISKRGHIHRLLLPIILHSSFGHLFWNLLSFFMIGFSIEKAIGKWYKYLMLIIFGGIGGNLFSSVISPYSVGIGASSSLFALMGA
jgi:membrane associated rhomboid family serine protease